MKEQKGLHFTAYGGCKGDEYIPYIPVDKALPELTWLSVIAGIIFAVIFGAANTYLGLKVGMTIAAGLPTAILASGVLKGLFKHNNILEINVIQAMGSMGESLAGGLIFCIPAVILLGGNLTITTITIVGIMGGLLGIAFVVPLRRFLIVEEHGNLIYPEGMAASEVLVSSSEGGKGLAMMLTGVGVGALYKFLSEGMAFWKYEPEWNIKPLQNTIIGADVLASLIGVGYIVGIEIGMYMFAGALVAWLGIIPMIKFFGAASTVAIFPAAVTVAEMDAWSIWSKYIRYIGAGAVAAGGFISVIKNMPTIVRSFSAAIKGLSHKGSSRKADLDIPMTWVIAIALMVFIAVWLMPLANTVVGPFGGVLVLIFSFFFSVVSARLVGVIGTSNNPISGMTIASLLLTAAGLKATGVIGDAGMIAAIIAGATICCAIAVAGGAAQSLKTTYIIGGTPKKVEIGMIVGIISSAAAIGFVILMLNKAYGIGSEQVAAPQATIMSMISKGIMSGNLPWDLVLIGAVFGIMCELMKIPVLPFALGLYLPIHLSAGVVIGGIIRVLVDRKYKADTELLKQKTEKGILLASGLVAGDAIMGIFIAVFTIAGWTETMAIGPKLLPGIVASPWAAAVMCLVLCAFMYSLINKPENA
ncbi:MAG: OPT family oligopeptide transporter [Pseudomonadota bacterium]